MAITREHFNAAMAAGLTRSRYAVSASTDEIVLLYLQCGLADQALRLLTEKHASDRAYLTALDAKERAVT